ncbi:MAG: DUF2934 domain-containing protein [Nitrospirae bacterium]|nr:DUF2934 domain-containing protein [Nitrospirota bacterium]
MDRKLHDEIAKVAYELYEKKGRLEGRHHEDWMEAENIVKARYAKAEQRKPPRKGDTAETLKEKAAKPERRTSSGKKTTRKGAAAKKTE